MDLCIQYGIASAIEAFADSGLSVTDENAPRNGVSIGSGIGGLTTIEEADHVLINQGPRKISPFFISFLVVNRLIKNFLFFSILLLILNTF